MPIPTMHTSHGQRLARRNRKYRATPANIGALIDLYLRHQQLSVVIDNYLTHSLSGKDSEEELQQLQIESLHNQITAHKHIAALNLPRWRALPEQLKQIFKIAAVGSNRDSIAVTCNVGSETAASALVASRGVSVYIGRKLRDTLRSADLATSFALVLEEAMDRQSCNPELHFHAVFQCPAHHRPKLHSALVKAFASDYVEIFNNQAVDIRPITKPGGWGGYCCKTLPRENHLGSRAVFSSKAASRAGEHLYLEVMRWLRSLPTSNQLKADLSGLLGPLIKAEACPELLQLIAQHSAQRKERRLRRRQQGAQYKQLAASEPEWFRRELVQQLRPASCEVTSSSTAPAQHAESTISPDHTHTTAERHIALAERYRTHPGFGEWAITEDDDETLFGNHPDPES
ncbi:hypothetical protein NVV93_08610 [Pseudomonas sp. LS44]|uniref:hypothetical protein n=1 Tax=Pseudomonas sp. LS44 TaxID=1357074 RepID=UPI00215B73A4|nr:hypothetical protein [Pseudomonas sp. LS44]UVE19420.1 hypothetical protein NVV93_08610 [Pseudomonas sp. LS44]